MTPIEELNDLISEQVDRVAKGIGIDTEIALLKDLQRMSELGVLTVYASSEIPEIKIEGNTTKVEYRQPRLMFTGEDEITRLRTELDQLKAKHKEDVIKHSVEIAKILISNPIEKSGKTAKELVNAYFDNHQNKEG
jgi:hypothetical protein